LKIRFQADANLSPAIGAGLLRREPAVDWQVALGVIPDATPDPEVLMLAAQSGRVLVSRDISTLPGHFASFSASHHSPGLILIPRPMRIGVTIERLLQFWLLWSAEELGARSGGSLRAGRINWTVLPTNRDRSLTVAALFEGLAFADSRSESR
jgi:hypothetical protein